MTRPGWSPAGRRDPQPVARAGDLALVVVSGVVVVLGSAALAGLGVASAVFGGGWVWSPNSEAAARVVAGIAAGNAARGLSPEDAARVPGPWAVYGTVGVVEVVAVTLLVTAAVLVARYRTPGDARRGMATRGQANDVLGVRRLRAARGVIRPDLHPGRNHPPRARRGSRSGWRGRTGRVQVSGRPEDRSW